MSRKKKHRRSRTLTLSSNERNIAALHGITFKDPDWEADRKALCLLYIRQGGELTAGQWRKVRRMSADSVQEQAEARAKARERAAARDERRTAENLDRQLLGRMVW